MGGPGMRLAGEELRKRLEQVPQWKLGDGRSLSKTFLFSDFQTALNFVNRVAKVAETQGHHPDMHLAWGRVDVTTSTHDEGGLTEKDLILASNVDEIFFKR